MRRARPPETAPVFRARPRFAGLLLWGAVFVGVWGPAGAAESCRSAELVRVHDGDTVSLRCDTVLVKLRFADIDAPEYRQPGGRQAREALVALLDNRRLVVETRATDRYGRRIGDILVGDEKVSLRLVSQGWAWCGPRSARTCRSRQDAARDARRGLWQDAAPVPPWRWREQHPYRP